MMSEMKIEILLARMTECMTFFDNVYRDLKYLKRRGGIIQIMLSKSYVV